MSDQSNSSSCFEVLESIDLVVDILLYLVDDARSLLPLATVSHSFHAAVLDSNQVWKEACHHRWKKKWGFVDRWEMVERESQSSGTWWRDRYWWQEEDAKRNAITADELRGLTWDMRFWLSPFAEVVSVLDSGLRCTASQVVQFVDDTEADPRFTHHCWAGMGILKGHPSGRTDLEWFLDEGGQGLQWGKLPRLFPKAIVVRLETWGWELRNSNVCLRAMEDPRGADDENLWQDYWESLAMYRTSFVTHTGVAMLEVPPPFWEFSQNRRQFPFRSIEE
jgi:hypothetical protein